MSEVKTAAPKKRSTLRQGNLLDMPEQLLDRSKYAYHWLNAENLAAASDGYEPRGFELFKDKDGKTIKRGDLVLGQMPIDLANERQAAREEDRLHQMALLLESQAANEEALTHEFKKKGGKVKFKFEQD